MSYSENNTFEKIMDRMLSSEHLTNVDKRMGSIIYDAIAPCALELAEAYQKIDILESETYLLTATGNNLDKRTYDYGISRFPAVASQRIAEFKKYKIENGQIVLDENDEKVLEDMDIPIGSRFIVPNSDFIFSFIGEINGNKIVECEAAGSGGNDPIGTILPMVPITDLIEANIIGTYRYGEDEETDEDLRTRTQNHITNTAYGGNIADYIEKVNSIEGVGNTKVFPVWRGGGTVLLSVVDPSYNPISVEFAENIKEQIDPINNSGSGYGIAPIGHSVTITTPVEETVNISLVVQIESGAQIGEVGQEIETVLGVYINAQRRKFAQNQTIAIYRSRIIEAVLQGVSDVLNITSIEINGENADIIYEDEGEIGEQYLPKLGTVSVSEAQ